MTLLAASGFAALIPLLLVLACPLMMIFMMRGMHGHSGHAPDHDGYHSRDRMTLDELKRERDMLNEQIADRAEQITDQRREAVTP